MRNKACKGAEADWRSGGGGGGGGGGKPLLKPLLIAGRTLSMSSARWHLDA